MNISQPLSDSDVSFNTSSFFYCFLYAFDCKYFTLRNVNLQKKGLFKGIQVTFYTQNISSSLTLI